MFPTTIWVIGWFAIKSSWRTYLLNLVKFSRRSKPFTSITSTPCHTWQGFQLKCTLIGWKAHPCSFFKLNIDGITQENSRRSNARGLIRDQLKCTLIGWKAHPYSFFKLNIDGITQGNSRRINARGLIRDQWFSRSIGYTHFMVAELWGICHGIDTPSIVSIIISDFSTPPPVVFCTGF